MRKAHVKTGFLFIGLSIIVSALYAQSTTSNLETNFKGSYTELKKNFNVLPSESRLRCYWWWLNSMATKESITRDLEEMRAKGYGGASLVDAGSSYYSVARKTEAGPVFMSDAWMELYKHAVKEADRVGIELSVNVQSGWNLGGPSITPEFAMKKIVWSEVDIKGGSRVAVTLQKPEVTLWYEDIVVQAVKKKGQVIGNNAIKNWDIKSFQKAIGWKGIYPLHELRTDYPETTGKEPALENSEIIDVTSFCKDSILEWDAPEGEWTIIRYGYTCTGAVTSTTSDGWNGFSLDHLSARAFELFSKTVIIPLIATAQSAGNSVKFLQTDSWEMGTVSWTKHFPEEFKKFRGYSIFPYLPVLTGRIVQGRDVSNRFLHDFRKTVGDCVEKNHYQLFYNLAHQYGLGIHPESGGPHSAPVDALKVMAISDFPQGEFWATANTHRIKDDERLSVRQSACVAHTNGKRFVAAEGPTSIGPHWERSPKDLKGNIDRVYCSGVNRIVWHTFTSSPKEFGLPGNEYFAGTHLNPNVTWWNKSNDFISYLNRCSYMLQQGLFVADVLYYYGDDVPNFVFLKEEITELPFGIDWDKCSKDVILNRASFDDSGIVLPDGMHYRLLMLAPGQAIDLEVLKKVEALVLQGATIISPRPEKVTGLRSYPDSDLELKTIADRMWRKIDGSSVLENQYGKGKVIWGKSVETVLADMQIVPDFSFVSVNANTALDYIHRSCEDQEIYFISNRFAFKQFNDSQYRNLPVLPDRYEEVECRFRVQGMVPEIWDPVTGKITEIVIYREENGSTVIPLHFEPEGSKFIVFRKAETNRHIVKIRKGDQSLFPGYPSVPGEYPSANAYKANGKVILETSQMGEYEITWSDSTRSKIKNRTTPVSTKLTGTWKIEFDPTWGAPKQVTADTLKSWTDFNEEGIRYYSGTANYSCSFNLKEINTRKNRYMLDLGNVQEMASVKINGHPMQVLWCAPFRFDITPFVKAGDNRLEVEVVNMWVNRLVGDGKLPPEQRLTKTNINKFDAPDAVKYLRPSGLIGPVALIQYPIIQLIK